MKRRLIGLTAPLLAIALVACGPEEDSTVSTGGTTTTEDGVEISLGSGTGSNFNEGVMSASVGSTSLSAGGTTTITVNIVDINNSNALYTGVPVEVIFASSCVDDSKASFSKDTVSTSTGTASTIYQAEGCVGSDAISASVDSATASVQITVSPADVNAIGFVGMSATSIAYANAATASQPNYSVVEFSLVDDRGNPVEGQTVDFSFSSSDANAGVALSNTSSVSDDSGIVSTIVNAGTSATNVRVVATFTPTSGTAISTESPSIAINTGPVDVDSFSLSVSDASVKNAYSTDGITTTFSIQAADRHNNPVADGTVISFWAEYGHIEPTCETTGGSCSGVTWTSGGTRPLDGLATIVAYTTGEDSFIDSGQKNGIYNVSGEVGLAADETRIVLPEMYYDLNYDGFDAAGSNFVDAGTGLNVDSDVFNDYNGNGTYEATSTKYRGSACSTGAIAAGHCAETSIQVWDQTQLALNTRTPIATLAAGPWTAGNSYSIAVTDSLGNFPPVGTTVSMAALGAAVADVDLTGTVPSVGESGASAYSFYAYVNEVTAAGTHKITVSIPGGVEVIYTIAIN